MKDQPTRIAVVSPAGRFSPERLALSEALLAGWGLELVPAPGLNAPGRYTAGDRRARAADLAWALQSPGIDAVWFARGGYGTVHTLPYLPWEALRGRPVWGFSDATALFGAMQGRGVTGAVHGPVLQSLADHVDEDSRAATRALLLEGRASPLPGQQIAGPLREVSGPLLGGNLAVMASVCGTPWAWRARGAILVLEDIGEAPYRLDRCLTQLLESGALDGVLGVALGEFTRCPLPRDADWTIEQQLAELLEPLDVPVVAGLPVGHGARNRPWAQGARATLHARGVDVG